jgi:hypothetical protein
VSRREDVAAAARELAGLSAETTPDDYAELLAPTGIDSAQLRADVVRRTTPPPIVSSCGLTVRGLLRRLGVVHPVLARPFVPTHGISDLITIANDAKALRHPLEDDGPGLGDWPIVGVDPHLHVYTVTGFRLVGDPLDAAAWHLDSIDGGQLDGSAILARSRSWSLVGAELVDDVHAIQGEARAPAVRRPMWRYIDCLAVLDAFAS